MPFPYKSLSLSVIETQKNIMGKFINPFTDYGFKKIFGQEVSKELLIEFLNDLLEGERVITDLTFLNNEQLPIYPGERIAIYDIFCTTDTGEKIIVPGLFQGTCSVLPFSCHCPSGCEGRELEVRYKSGVWSIFH